MSVMANPTTSLYPARKGPRPFTADDLWAIPRVGTPVFSPDGATLAVPVTTCDLEKNESRARIWLVPSAGGEPRGLTSPDLSSGVPAFSPDGRTLAFMRKAEKGMSQLHLMPLDGGEARCVTSLPLGAFDPRWLPDGSGVVFGTQLVKGHLTPEATAAEIERRDQDPVKAHATEERFYRYWDTWLTTGEMVHLFLYDLASGKLRDLTPEAVTWFDWMDPTGQYDVSPDGKEIAWSGIFYDEKRSLILTSVFTTPIAGGAITSLTPDAPADNLRPRYSPGGKFLVWGATQDPEFYADRVRLMRHDRATRKTEEWLGSWDLSPAHWEFAGDDTLVIEAEKNARVALFAWKGAGEPRAISEGGTAGGFSVHQGRVAFTHQTLVDPAEAWIAAIDGGAATRVTHFTGEVTGRFTLGEVREMTFDGSHGESVQMFLVFPPDHDPRKKYPLVQVIHGGPHGISADLFSPRWNAQLFAAPGYIVAMVNFQGSTSWGQDFAQRIQGAWAERPYEDVIKATDVLVASGMVDEGRMAAAGGSYGGYLATWIAGHTDRFRCIVNHAGVADLTGQYASDVTQGRGKASGGEVWDGLEKQDKWSPIRFARGFVTPMLVIHGEKDYRVPVGQGLLCYGVLKAKGVPARLVYFPDENHWVLKPKNHIYWFREVHDWLARWLGA